MGKLKFRGLVPPDDPMFSGQVEFFTKANVSPSDKKNEQQVFVREVAVNWDADLVTIDLDEDSWARVSVGMEVILEQLDSSDEIEYRWLFNSDPKYSLIVDFGDPNHLRWLGQLSQAEITEISNKP